MGEHKKAFWVVGIALIIFLVLLFGSIFGLKLVRDKANEIQNDPALIGGQGNDNVLNYRELEDGTKENISDSIREAEFEIEGVKLSGFSIKSKDGSSTITANIENTTEEVIAGKTFMIELIDANGENVTEFTMDIAELAAKVPTITIRTLNTDCANAETIDVSIAGANSEVEVSGEAIVSGEVQE